MGGEEGGTLAPGRNTTTPSTSTLAFSSDHPQCPGGHHNSAAYLPAKENSYRYCTDQRSQQVWTCPRAGGGVSPKAAEALIPLSLFPQGLRICHVFHSLPTGHFLPSLPLHRLLGLHGRVSILKPVPATWGCVCVAPSFASSFPLPALEPEFLNTPSAFCPHPTKPSIRSSVIIITVLLLGKPVTQRWVSGVQGPSGGRGLLGAVSFAPTAHR